MGREARWGAELSKREKEIAHARQRVIQRLLDQKARKPTVEAVGHTSKKGLRTVYRWLQAYRRGGIVALAKSKRSDRGKSRTVPQWLVAKVQAWYLEMAKRTARQVWIKARGEARRAHITPPSYQTVRRICKRLDPAVLCLAKEGEKSFRDQFEPVGRYEVGEMNQRWHIDHTLIDVHLRRPGRKPGRPWLTAVLEARSRGLVGYFLGFERPSSLEVSLALRMGILPKRRAEWPMCGIPDEIFVDNGSDLISTHMKDVANNLRFQLVPSRSGPRHNGKLERFFETLSTGLLCELPGYCGRNPKEKPEHIVPTLTLEVFEAKFEEWVVRQYHETPNGTTGEAPLERWKGDFVPRLPDTIRELDLLLVHQAKPRRIWPDGIRLFTRRYMAEELIPYIRESVVVRYDPRDLSEVQVYGRDRWLCAAKSMDPDDPVTSLKEIRHLQRKRRKEVAAARDDVLVRGGLKVRREGRRPKGIRIRGTSSKPKYVLWATDLEPGP